MKAPSTFTVRDFGAEAARQLTDFIAQVARGLDRGLTLESNTRAEWREVTWVAGQSAGLQIATTITQPKAVLLAAIRPEQETAYVSESWGVITTDGAGGTSIADAGTGDWTVDLSGTVVRVTLDPPMVDTVYVPSGAVLSTTHRFVVPEVSSASQFLLHVWNATPVEIDASATALTLRFDLRGRRTGRPVGGATLDWDRSAGGIVIRDIYGLVHGQRYQVRLLVVER